MNKDQARALLEQYSPAQLIDLFEPVINDERKAKIQAVLKNRLTQVEIAIEAPSDPRNAAAVVRTAEALGINAVHVMAVEGKALHAKLTTQGAFHWVDTYHHVDLGCFFNAKASESERLYFGAAMDGELTLDELPIDKPICLVLGNETRGLSDAMRARCDGLYRIPMYGMSQSLNLSVSAAISAYHLCHQIRSRGVPTLSEEEYAHLLAQYYLFDLEQRVVQTMIKRYLA